MTIRKEYKEGEKIGTCLFVREYGGSSYKRKAVFKCGYCEKEFVGYLPKIKSGHTRSCGCLRIETAKSYKTHGLVGTPEYNSWCSMNERCYNTKLKEYKYWGGKGVRVCDRWRHSFENFLADMGERPTLNHTLDRFPNSDGDYEPSNCRWATKREQVMNRRNTLKVWYKNELKPLSEWCLKLGLNYDFVQQRITRDKMTPKEAFETPKLVNQHSKKLKESNFISHSFGHIN